MSNCYRNVTDQVEIMVEHFKENRMYSDKRIVHKETRDLLVEDKEIELDIVITAEIRRTK
jgi:hypothetical protein